MAACMVAPTKIIAGALGLLWLCRDTADGASLPSACTRRLPSCVFMLLRCAVLLSAAAGLGMSLGIEVLQVPGTTGDYRTLFHK